MTFPNLEAVFGEPIAASDTTFADFAQLNGSQLGTGKTITSTSFAVGLGIGMNATPRIQVYVIQEYAVILNKKSSMVTNNNGQQQTFRFGGRDMRLTDVHGEVIKSVLA